MMLKNTTIFIFSFLFNSILFRNLVNRNLDAAKSNFDNIKTDLERISFPIYFEIDSYLIVSFVSLLSTVFIYYFVQNKFTIESPLNVLTDILKLFLIYAGTLLGLIYLFRQYDLSRGILIIFIFAFPIFMYLLLLLLNLGNVRKFFDVKFVKGVQLFILIVSVSLFLFQITNNDDDFSINYEDPNKIDEVEPFKIDKDDAEDTICKSWLGSENFTECILGSEIVSIEEYPESLNNLVVFKGDKYILNVSGKIYKNNKNNVFLNLTNKILNREQRGEGSAGLFSLAFHPSDNYFIVTYTNNENNLEISKINLDKNNLPILDSLQILYSIPNTSGYHYGGNIIWSNYFNDFIFGVGDMFDEAIDTTSPRRKLLFVNSNISKTDLISHDKYGIARKDVLAFGLRQPWKFMEYKNYLIVPDIGRYTMEELNVIDLNDFSNSKKPFFFGWPYYEATIVDERPFWDTRPYIDNSPGDLRKYSEDNVTMPKVFYTHDAPENYRAAIIGGGVITNSESKYFEHFIFADYLSNELFAYDFINNQLKILPLQTLGSPITSVTVDDNNFDSILITLKAGVILQVQLP